LAYFRIISTLIHYDHEMNSQCGPDTLLLPG